MQDQAAAQSFNPVFVRSGLMKSAIARFELKSAIASAILSGASLNTLKKLEESWHSDVCSAVKAIDDFYDCALERTPRMGARHVLFLSNETGAVWTKWMGSNESYMGEAHRQYTRLAERDGELPLLWIEGDQGMLPLSVVQFRGRFAYTIAGVLVENFAA
jgi:hypothetical protein